MAFRVVVLSRASREISEIVDWLSARSSRGAVRWVQALDAALNKLAVGALSCAWAQEEELEELAIRQCTFKTRRGRLYRILFKVAENEVRVLHVGGPGQAPLTSRDIPVV